MILIPHYLSTKAQKYRISKELQSQVNYLSKVIPSPQMSPLSKEHSFLTLFTTENRQKRRDRDREIVVVLAAVKDPKLKVTHMAINGRVPLPPRQCYKVIRLKKARK